LRKRNGGGKPKGGGSSFHDFGRDEVTTEGVKSIYGRNKKGRSYFFEKK